MSYKRYLSFTLVQILVILFLSSAFAYEKHNSPFCGPEVLSRVYEKLKVGYSLEKISAIAGKSHGFTSYDDLINDAKRHQLKAFVFKEGDRITLEAAFLQGPVIINNRGHFVLIENVTDRGVSIYDPGFGFEHYTLPWEMFQGHWDGYGLVLNKKPVLLDSKK